MSCSSCTVDPECPEVRDSLIHVLENMETFFYKYFHSYEGGETGTYVGYLIIFGNKINLICFMNTFTWQVHLYNLVLGTELIFPR